MGSSKSSSNPNHAVLNGIPAYVSEQSIVHDVANKDQHNQ